MTGTTFDLKLRFSDIVFFAVWIVALALGSQMLSLDSDLGRHLVLGDYMLEKRIIPTHDLLSHTRAGLSRPPYEWLAQVLFALAHRLAGVDGVIVFTSLVIAWTFTLVYVFAIRRSRLPVLGLILIFIAAGASSIHWLPRPHIFTLLLLAVWIEGLEMLIQGKSVQLCLFPLAMLLWVNMHGGFIFGLLAWVAYFAGWLWDAWRRKADRHTGKNLFITGTTSLIATVITPDLWHNWEAVLNNRSAFILNRTVETMRPVLTDPSVLPYTFLLLLAILLFALNWKTLKTGQFFLLTGLGLMSLFMARNIPLFIIACTPVLSELSAGRLSGSKAWTKVEARFTGFNPKSGRGIWQPVVAVLVIASFVFSNPKRSHPFYQFDPNVFPAKAADYLEANPQSGHMFNDFNWGGYLLYRLWPHYTVFLDSQSDFYGENLMREYDRIMNADNGWQGLLDQYEVDWLVVPVRSPLANEIANDLGWEIIYQDITSVIGLRK